MQEEISKETKTPEEILQPEPTPVQKKLLISKITQTKYFPVLLTVSLLILVFSSSFFLAYKTKNTKQSPAPTPTPTLFSEQNMENWKTYIKEGNGFKISYPLDWYIEETRNFSKNDYTFYIRPEKPSVDKDIYLTVQILKNDVATYLFGICCEEGKKEIEHIGSNNFFTSGPITIEGMFEWIYYTGSKDRLARFSLGIGKRDDPTPPSTKPEDIAKEFKDFNQILSTFEFLHDASDWKTYVNTNLGFQISYPEDWTLKENMNTNYPGMVTISPKTATQENVYQGSVVVLPNYATTTSSDILVVAKEIQEAEKGVAEYKPEKIEKIGENRYWIASGGCCMDIGKHAFTINGTSVYRITLHNLEQNFSETELQIFNKMLSSLKFPD